MEQEKVTNFKRNGEAALRASGLGYTIVRPGAIIDEPGGYKALVFDQVLTSATAPGSRAHCAAGGA